MIPRRAAMFYVVPAILYTLPQYSECDSSPNLLKIGFFFRRRISDTTTFSTTTYLNYYKIE